MTREAIEAGNREVRIGKFGRQYMCNKAVRNR